MAIDKKTAQQAKKVHEKKQAPVGSGTLKGWSFSTSMRNPGRIGQILGIVIKDKRARKGKAADRTWGIETQAWLFSQLKENEYYNEGSNRNSDVVGDAERGRTATSPTSQIGFLQAEPGKPLTVTPLGALYAKALDDEDGILAEDYLLLALSRLRLILNKEGEAQQYRAGQKVKGTPTAPLGHIIDLFLDEGVFETGGITLTRAQYLIPLAVSAAAKPTLLSLAHSKTFEKDLATTIKGNINTVQEYGDTLVRYLLLSGLFTRDSSTGKPKIAIAPGREYQARRIRDALLDPSAMAETADWDTYRGALTRAPEGTFPWHGSTQDYEDDCSEIAAVILKLTGEAPEYHPEDHKAHILLRQQLGEVQERKYIASGQSLADLPHNLKIVRTATEKNKRNGKTVSPLNFEAAVLKASTAMAHIGKFAPNYLKDNNNKPIAHAPGKDGDGWLHGQGEHGPHLLLEASLQGGRSQALTEWQPAIRHMKSKKVNGQALDPEQTAGLLVMTSLHEDTIGMCTQAAYSMHNPENVRPTPAYLLPMTHTQYARLLENTVADGKRLATLEELVDWIKDTSKAIATCKNVSEPAVFGAFMDEQIERWNAQMLERASKAANEQGVARKAKP